MMRVVRIKMIKWHSVNSGNRILNFGFHWCYDIHRLEKATGRPRQGKDDDTEAGSKGKSEEICQ